MLCDWCVVIFAFNHLLASFITFHFIPTIFDMYVVSIFLFSIYVEKHPGFSGRFMAQLYHGEVLMERLNTARKRAREVRLVRGCGNSPAQCGKIIVFYLDCLCFFRLLYVYLVFF